MKFQRGTIAGRIANEDIKSGEKVVDDGEGGVFHQYNDYERVFGIALKNAKRGEPLMIRVTG